MSDDEEREPVPYDVLMRGLRCPRCATRLTGHQTDEDDTRPKDEDWTICWYCEGLLRYSQTAFGWSLVTAEWPYKDVDMMLRISDLYGQMRALKSVGGRASGWGQDVPERDGQR